MYSTPRVHTVVLLKYKTEIHNKENLILDDCVRATGGQCEGGSRMQRRDLMNVQESKNVNKHPFSGSVVVPKLMDSTDESLLFVF